MDDEHRIVVEAAYVQLRETLEAKDVSVQSLRTAALQALAHARDEVELDSTWVAGELDRLQDARRAPADTRPAPHGDPPDVKPAKDVT